MRLSPLIACALVALALAAPGQQRMDDPRDPREDYWLRWESRLLDAYARADAFAAGGTLAEDFTLTVGGRSYAGGRLAEAARGWSGRYEVVELSERRAVFDSGEVITTGVVTVRERGATAAGLDTPVKGEPAAASAQAVVNVRELAREEAARPPGPERRVAVHSPVSLPEVNPVPAAAQPTRYRYRAVYTNHPRRGARARSLELTPEP